MKVDSPAAFTETAPMPERAVFLDRDNTIIENDGYLGVAAQVKLLPGAATALSAIRSMGYRLIVVSNQSGVARGLFSEADVEAVNQEMCRQLREQASAHIDASYYCPYHPEAAIAEYKIDHDWRKPKPGMLLQAAVDFNLDLAQCWMIGDQPRDIAAGTAAGCRTILLKDPDRIPADADPAVPVASTPLEISPNFIVKTLADAARIVSREGKAPPPISQPAPSAKMALPVAPPVAAPTFEAAAEQVSNAGEKRIAPAAAPELAAAAAPAERFASANPRLERNLEELVSHLRQQNRNAEAPPDFSRARAAALLVQIMAILALIFGIYRWVTAGVAVEPPKAANLVFTNLSTATFWVLVAGVLQIGVITLLHFSRER
jgi:D-glycero-D-manno-heptose 1,7-bisphosphate phosphatase